MGDPIYFLNEFDMQTAPSSLGYVPAYLEFEVAAAAAPMIPARPSVPAAPVIAYVSQRAADAKIAAATERAEKAERERDEAEARAERLAGLLAEAGSVLLGNAAVLHRHVLTTGSERSNRTANRARDVAAKIDAALKDTP